MSTVLLQRLLLILALLLSIGAGTADAMFPDALSAEARQHVAALLTLRQSATGGAFTVVSGVHELLLLVSVFGMFQGKRWGFYLGLVVTLLTMVQAHLMAPHVYSGVSYLLAYAGHVAWGGALALALATMAPARAPAA